MALERLDQRQRGAGAQVQRCSRAGRLSDHRSYVSTSSSSAPAAPACAPRSAARKPALRTACISKVSSRPAPIRSRRRAASPPRSPTWAPDNWKWHMYDTVKGSDWLGDQDSIEYLCRNAPQAVYELEHWGVPFSRTEDGQDLPAPIRRHDHGFWQGAAGAQRTCAAADRTGHAILHTLYGQALRANTEFFIEYLRHRSYHGQRTLRRRRSASSSMTARSTGFAPSSSSSRRAVTAAPISLRRRRTPAPATAMPWFCARGCRCRTWNSCNSIRRASTASGCLITEGARGEGGYLTNGEGERFMERYAPSA